MPTTTPPAAGSDGVLTNTAGSAAVSPALSAAVPTFPDHAMAPLDGDTGADVCVVGASFVGLRTAYDLLEKGKSVVVLECAASLPAPATSSALAHAIVRLGGRIHGATRALDISAEHNMQVVTTYQGAIVARVVVVATDQRTLGAGSRAGEARQLNPGESPALRILTTRAPDIAALFKPASGRRAA